MKANRQTWESYCNGKEWRVWWVVLDLEGKQKQKQKHFTHNLFSISNNCLLCKNANFGHMNRSLKSNLEVTAAQSPVSSYRVFFLLAPCSLTLKCLEWLDTKKPEEATSLSLKKIEILIIVRFWSQLTGWNSDKENSVGGGAPSKCEKFDSVLWWYFS